MSKIQMSWELLALADEVRDAVSTVMDASHDVFKNELDMLSFRSQILDTIYLLFDKKFRQAE